MERELTGTVDTDRRSVVKIPVRQVTRPSHSGQPPVLKHDQHCTEYCGNNEADVLYPELRKHQSTAEEKMRAASLKRSIEINGIREKLAPRTGFGAGDYK